MNQIVIKDVATHHPDLKELITQLDDYLYRLYPAEEVSQVDLEKDDIEFVVTYVQGVPVGCGAIKRLDQYTAELKRFFVLPNYRNQGIAAIMLQALEEKARKSNYTVIKLETGDPQFEAVQFYMKNGYCRIERYGEYIDCPSSVCFEKGL